MWQRTEERQKQEESPRYSLTLNSPFKCYTSSGGPCLSSSRMEVKAYALTAESAPEERAALALALALAYPLAPSFPHWEAAPTAGQVATDDRGPCLSSFVFSFLMDDFPCSHGEQQEELNFLCNLCGHMVLFPPFGRKDCDIGYFGGWL